MTTDFNVSLNQKIVEYNKIMLEKSSLPSNKCEKHWKIYIKCFWSIVSAHALRQRYKNIIHRTNKKNEKFFRIHAVLLLLGSYIVIHQFDICYSFAFWKIKRKYRTPKQNNNDEKYLKMLFCSTCTRKRIEF